MRVEALYWSAINPDVFTPDSFPTFLYINEDEYFEFYGIPIEEYHGLLRVRLSMIHPLIFIIAFMFTIC